MVAPSRPALLVITPRFPAPPVGGDRLRIFNIITHLAADFDVDLFSLYGSDDELADMARMKRVCREVRVFRVGLAARLGNIVRGWLRGLPLQVALYDSAAARRDLRDWTAARRYDAVLAHLVRTAEYTRDFERRRVVLELTDAIAMNYYRIARPRTPLELVYLIERRRLAAYEAAATWRAGSAVVVAEADRRFLVDRGGDGSVEVITNGTDVRPVPGAVVDPMTVAFLGNLGSAPNRDMVLRFVEGVLPRIRERVPRVRFLVVGANPPAAVRRLNDGTSVVVTGAVPDATRVLAQARVSVCPMRFGAGVQNKVLESMAVGVPVVTTPAGLEGIDAVAGREILVAADDEQFAAEVVRVLQDDGLHGALSQAGREFVDRCFRWDRPMAAYRELMAASAAPRESADDGA